MVLSSADRTEYTAIAFDTLRDQVVLDRSKSGLRMNEDVRGGPWPAPASDTVSVHIFVDHVVVELIANSTHKHFSGNVLADESTAIAAWVSPTSASSNRLALFSEISGVTLVECDIWQLASPSVAS